MRNRREILVSLSAIGAMLSGGVGVAQTSAPVPMPVVASFSILADFVKQVGGDRVALTTLVGAGGDAHDYTPTPADARALAGSKVIFVNGLGFEGWFDRLIKSSGSKAAIITATRTIKPLKAEDRGAAHGHTDHSHGDADPHAWQSVANAKIYVGNILAGLIAADPDGKAVYEANAKAYVSQLDMLDAEVKAATGQIPAARRKVITSHDAFQYFEKAYGIDFISPRGVSTSAEPSPQALARIIRQIKTEKIPAVFLENIADQRLMKRIADETSAKIGGQLYSDALTTADGPAASYIALMRHNVRQISGALAAS